MLAQRSEQCLGPLRIQGSVGLIDQEVVPINQRKGNNNTKSTIQRSDFEGVDHLQVPGLQPGYEPTEALVTEGNQQPQLKDHTVVNAWDPEPEAEDGYFSEPMRYEGWLSFLEDFILGRNRSNPIWRLRLLSAFCLYTAALIGILYYPDVRRVMLITSIGAPISVAAISLSVSFWLASVPNRRSNWITGLSVANVIMLCGPLAFTWAHKRETTN